MPLDMIFIILLCLFFRGEISVFSVDRISPFWCSFSYQCLLSLPTCLMSHILNTLTTRFTNCIFTVPRCQWINEKVCMCGNLNSKRMVFVDVLLTKLKSWFSTCMPSREQAATLLYCVPFVSNVLFLHLLLSALAFSMFYISMVIKFPNCGQHFLSRIPWNVAN